MKTLQRRIQQAARERRVSQLVVERDYAQSYVLAGIASTETLSQALVFKGGTALKRRRPSSAVKQSSQRSLPRLLPKN